MLYKIILFLYLLLFCGILNAQNLSINLTEELVIGDDENASEEYLFLRPTQICTDSKSNIYVADYNRGEIRVFNQQGKYIKSIGKKGKGPGEILEVISMTIDKNDDLIIVDRLNDRFTRFTDFGNSFKVYPMTVDHIIDAHAIAPLGTEGYLLYYYIKHSKNNRYTIGEDKVMHLYSSDFSKIHKSFIKAEEICDLNDRFLLSRVGKYGSHFCVINPNTIIFAPEFYKGVLYLYERKNDNWHLKLLKGREPKQKPYKMLNLKNYNYPKENYPPNIYMTSGSMGIFFGQYQNRSIGLFQLDNEYIIHITWTRISKEKWIFIAELFSKDGRFIDSCQVQDNLSFTGKDGCTQIFSEMFWYSENLLYGNAIYNYSPIVRVARLQYKL